MKPAYFEASCKTNDGTTINFERTEEEGGYIQIDIFGEPSSIWISVADQIRLRDWLNTLPLPTPESPPKETELRDRVKIIDEALKSTIMEFKRYVHHSNERFKSVAGALDKLATNGKQ